MPTSDPRVLEQASRAMMEHLIPRAAGIMLDMPDGNARNRGTPATNPYVRDERLGLAIRLLLASALNSREKLDAFLPKACDAWRRVAAEAWP